MKYYSRLLAFAFFALLIGVALLLVPGVAKPVLGHPSQTIDNMSVTQLVNQVGVGSTFSYTNGSTSNIIGGQREVTVTVTVEGSATIDMYFEAGAGEGNSVQAPSARGRTILVYDGTTDGGAAGVDPGGLGEVDLTAGGDTALVVVITASDRKGYITVTYYSGGSLTTCSSLTKQIPNNIGSSRVPQAIIFPFDRFTRGSGCSTAADKTKVGAIVIDVDGTAADNESWDVTFDLIETNQMDLGDLPTGYSSVSNKENYTKLYADNTYHDRGAAHVLAGSLRLGSNWDAESDGQTSSNATGDDTNGTSDDEDGVRTTSSAYWTRGTQVSVTVTINGGNGCLSAWIDWNSNSRFTEEDDWVLVNETVTTGSYVYTFTVPSSAPSSGQPLYFSRWRLFPRLANDTCPTPGDEFPYANAFQFWDYDSVNLVTSHIYGGEVEDHQIGRAPTAVKLETFSGVAVPMDTAIPVIGIVGGVGILGLLALRRRRS